MTLGSRSKRRSQTIPDLFHPLKILLTSYLPVVASYPSHVFRSTRLKGMAELSMVLSPKEPLVPNAHLAPAMKRDSNIDQEIG